MDAPHDFSNIRTQEEMDAWFSGHSSGYSDAKCNNIQESAYRIALSSESNVNRAWGQGYEAGALEYMNAVGKLKEARWKFWTALAGTLLGVILAAWLYTSFTA
jgi:hypothetical protein